MCLFAVIYIYIYNRGAWYALVKKMIKALATKYFAVLLGFVFRIFISGQSIPYANTTTSIVMV